MKRKEKKYKYLISTEHNGIKAHAYSLEPYDGDAETLEAAGFEMLAVDAVGRLDALVSPVINQGVLYGVGHDSYKAVFDKGLVPQASITRAQMALIIKKYETVVPKQIYESKNQHSPFLTMKSASGDYKVSGAGSWETTSGWGEEALLPSATADSVLVGGRIPSKSQSFSLYWDALPDSITIKRWSIESAGNEQASPIEELTINSPYSIVLDKNSIYELKAVWSEAQYKERGFHGTITYQFVTADY